MSNPNPIWISFERRRNAIEKIYKPKVFDALMNQVKAFTNHAKWNGLENAKAHIDTIVTGEDVHVVIKALYIKAGLLAANTAYSEVRRMKFSGFGYNQEWTNDILNYFRLNLLNKAVLPITDTTKNMIRTILEKAVQEGWGVDKTVSEILSYASEINRSRAALITRTESVRAMNAGTMIGADKSTIVLDKKWITAHDERVRPTHRMQDGMVIDMNDTFPNGCAFPGDPNASGGETINCRCTIGLVPKRDVNGRTIRRTPSRFVADHRQQPTELVGNIVESLIQEGK